MDSITIVLLLVVIALQLWNITKKSNIEELKVILQRTAEEQRDGVRKQIESGTTEQFQRFEVIQASIQKGVFRNLTPWLAIILTSIILQLHMI